MSNPQNTTVLIAEDDPVFRRLLQFTIERCGFKVVAVADGELAWARLQERGIDLLITDQQMPHCTGIDLLLRIANHSIADSDASPLVPACILCTAKGLEMDRERVREQFNLLAVMGKPFSPKQLSRLVEDYFDTRGVTTSLPDAETLNGESPTTTVNSRNDSSRSNVAIGLGHATRKRDVWNVCQTN